MMQQSRATMPGFELTPLDRIEGRRLLIANRATALGRQLGAQMARLCDREAETAGCDGRCDTCAFRGGDHIANGSPETLMDALKCVLERTPFFCHEPGRENAPCAGWLALRSPAGSEVTAPWPTMGGSDPLQDVPAGEVGR